MEKKLSQQELDERIAILKRFRSLLEAQRTKFQEYLHVLELQETKITQDDADALLAHSQLETQIVENIGSLQKVIAPMEALYRSTKTANYLPSQAIPIEQLQGDLKKLQSQVLIQNQKNRDMIRYQMSQLKEQISTFKNPYRNSKSIYADRGTTATRISISS